jgi:hypothetical protein
LRVEYGYEHEHDTVEDFWSLIFTDEVYIDPLLIKTGYILREEGTREDPDNM